MRNRLGPVLVAAGIMTATATLAEMDGHYSVILSNSSGVEVDVATLDVRGGQYSVAMNDAVFSDHFLSMRPFKCLEGPETLWCHVPYPYAIRRDLSEGKTDVEYDFLFVWKPQGSYGIDLWNGVYYRFDPSDMGLVATMYEMDMGRLAVPPEAGNLRPIDPDDLDEAEAGRHWLPRLELRPDP